MNALGALQKLTLGEVAAVESLSGLAITDIGDPGVPMGKVLAAVVYVWRRRTDPTFTFDDALNLPMDSIDAVLGGVAAADPTAPDA